MKRFDTQRASINRISLSKKRTSLYDRMSKRIDNARTFVRKNTLK